MRRLASLAIALALAVPTFFATSSTNSFAAAKKPLTITGRILNPGSGLSVVLLAADGTSTTAKVATWGTFKISVPAKLRTRFAPGKGAGPTLHLIRENSYVGPLLLKTKGTKGYLQLKPTIKGTIKLGTIKLDARGFGKTAKALSTKLRSNTSITLAKGAPKGAGAQGYRAKSAGFSTASMPQSVIKPKLRALGADADGDGIPNLADIDMNGDGYRDATQSDTALKLTDGSTLAGSQVLTGRPSGITFRKILNAPVNYSINTNRAGAATWAALTSYLQSNAEIETVITPQMIQDMVCVNGSNCAALKQVASARLDCRELAYCGANSHAIIIGSPGSGLDRQPLTTLRDSAGLIRIPTDSHAGAGLPYQTGFGLSFFPNVADPAGIQFTGDTFELVLTDAAGTVLGRSTSVLTSSVTTSHEISAVNGTALAANTNQATLTTVTRISIARPQALTTDGSPTLVDRGGLSYTAYFYTPSNAFYRCKPSQVTAVSGGLVGVSGNEALLRDTKMSPANGESLVFDVAVSDCLRDPASTSGSGALASGESVTLEIEAADSDNNATRAKIESNAP